MKTIIDINRELLEKIKHLSGSPTNKAAVHHAMEEYMRSQKRKELRSRLGKYPGFKLSLKDFHHLRHGR